VTISSIIFVVTEIFIYSWFKKAMWKRLFFYYQQNFSRFTKLAFANTTILTLSFAMDLLSRMFILDYYQLNRTVEDNKYGISIKCILLFRSFRPTNILLFKKESLVLRNHDKNLIFIRKIIRNKNSHVQKD
jgi:hypothetical protein